MYAKSEKSAEGVANIPLLTRQTPAPVTIECTASNAVTKYALVTVDLANDTGTIDNWDGTDLSNSTKFLGVALSDTRGGSSDLFVNVLVEGYVNVEAITSYHDDNIGRTIDNKKACRTLNKVQSKGLYFEEITTNPVQTV